MEVIGAVTIGVFVGGLIIAFLLRMKKPNNNNEQDQTLELEKKLASKEEKIIHLQSNKAVLEAKLSDFEKIKTDNTTLKERLINTENERNALKTKNTTLDNKEESRNEALRTSIDQSNTLQKSLENEKERLNDDRVKEKEEHLEEMKKLWVAHEKDVESHIQMICKNHTLTYISQEDFPHSRNKPDNTIEISNQMIVFDAKSPSNDDLSNFPKYIKLQTDNLKKYAKHPDVKKELFLVIPSNTLEVIKQFTYNMGDYNVYVITKDALEPIIISLKKIQDFESVEKLSPEDRDDICRIIGKFAQEILKSVIEFEGAEKLNPPMSKRSKMILIDDLDTKKSELSKEIELGNIPEIEAKITFKESDKGNLKK